jgi:hypothetical protein
VRTRVDHVTCQQFVHLLTDYLEGVVDPQQRADIERHIVICGGCATYADQMRTTIDLLGRVVAEDGGSAGAADLLDVFRTWRDERNAPDHDHEDGPP